MKSLGKIAASVASLILKARKRRQIVALANRDLRPAESLEPRILLFGDTVAFGESLTLIHEYDDNGGDPSSHTDSSTSAHFLANTGDENYFVWQDPNPATPDVTEIYYDFRPAGLYANLITAEQQASAEAALDAWEQAADGTIEFVRNTSASLEDIINIGVGDFAAFGYTSEPRGILGLGGGTVTHSEVHTITEGVAWLDYTETWDVTFGNEDPPNTFDAFTVFAHEIGHALGLGHTNDLPGADIMDGGYVGEKTQLSQNDSTLIQVLYGDAVDVVPDPRPAVEDSDVALAPDQVINDDVIVSFSMGIGFDATNGENFGFDTLRLKENNLRIHFDDTSNSGSFPNNDWRIVINDSTNGGDEYFMIEDSSAGRQPFRITAGAPSNSLYVDSQGDVGFGTSNPVTEMHVADGDTPTLRLEQNGTSGWTPQTWDIAANETNFFIRDVTNGSKLPFRIRPGAPASSIDIAGSGDVGLGTGSPSEELHVKRTDGTAKFLIEETSAGTIRDMLTLRNKGGSGLQLINTASGGGTWNLESQDDDSYRITLNGSGSQEMLIGDDGRVRFNIVSGTAAFDLDPSGNLTLAGTLTQGSSRAIKENIERVDSQQVLGVLAGLPVLQWNYISDANDTSHVGPMAEDFYAAFGLGADAQHIAPGDLAGVVLAGVQGLVDVVEQQNAQIDAVASVLGVESSLPEQASRGAADIIAWLSDYYGTQIAEMSGGSAATGDGSAGQSETSPAQAAETSTPVAASSPIYYALVPVDSASDGSGGQQYMVIPLPPDVHDGGVAEAGDAAGTAGSVTTVSGGSSTVLEQSQQVLAADQVINDDLIVRGSLGIGNDAVNGENFGFDTLRLKENNVRIHFDDTSNSASFPNNDWRIVINDSNNGGDSYFLIQDASANRDPFRILAGAPNNSLRVDSQGDVGFGTSNPVVELHSADGDTPTLRLEQNGTSGWTPQTWDVAGNETNFFIRDVTNGSKLSFRIRPGAPTSSIDIEGTSGDVGLGTAGASAALHLKRTDGSATILIEETSAGTLRDMLTLKNNGALGMYFNNTDSGATWVVETMDNDTFRFNRNGSGRQEMLLFSDGTVQLNVASGVEAFDLDPSGNLRINGTLTAPSSRALKEAFELADPQAVLDRLADLQVSEWSYIADANGVRHLGPMAEDFYAMFGLGEDAQHIAPGDLAGVALAGVQGLIGIIDQQGQELAYLAGIAGVETDLVVSQSAPATAAETTDVTAWLNDLYSRLNAHAAESTVAASAPANAVAPTGGGSGSTATTQEYVLVDLTGGADGSGGSSSAGSATTVVASQTAAASGESVSDSSPTIAADQVYNDDLIVKGSAAVGFDAVNGESFGFDTLRLKENNLRLHFDDTSVSASFPRNDWRIAINDTTNGGDEYFAIEDATAGRQTFRIDAGAPSHSLYVDSQGDVGFGTNNPVVELHASDGDTPTLRLEQNGTSGWTPQTWDLASNETNFFIRDVTNGSTLPFRIRPNAPTNSIDVAANGNVGLGTAGASAALHVKRTDGTAKVLVEDANATAGTQRDMLKLQNNGSVGMFLNDTGNNKTWAVETLDDFDFRVSLNGSGRQEMVIGDDGRVRFNTSASFTAFDLNSSGNATIAGTLTTGSSRTIKENFQSIDSQQVLDELADLPLLQWSYIADANGVRHFGPLAEDFYAAFGLGADAQHIAPGDLAGVALAGLQGVYDVVAQHDELLQAISAAVGVEYVSAVDAVELAAAEAPKHEAPSETASEETGAAAKSSPAAAAEPASSVVLSGLTLLAEEETVPGPDVSLDETSILITDEGGEVQLDLLIDDTVSEAFEVIVSWGDGSDDTELIVENDGRGLGESTVITHTYDDDDPTNTPSDDYTITIDVTNLSTTGTTQIGTTATVDNVAPILTGLMTTALDEGNSATVSGSIVDPGVDDTFEVTIEWGDGTNPTTVTADQIDPTFSVEHQFVSVGPFTVTVTVEDDDTGATSSTTTVSDRPTLLTNVTVTSSADGGAPGSSAVIDEGGAVDINGEITESGTYTIDIDLDGDGNFDQTTVKSGPGFFAVENLEYLDDDPTGTPTDTYDVVVRLTDQSDETVNESTVQVTVNNVAPTIEQIMATPLDGNNDSTVTVRFTDPAGTVVTGPDDTFDITVDWGDGTPNTVLPDQTITKMADEFMNFFRVFSLPHTFVGTGPFTVGVTIEDDDGGSTSGSVTVDDPGLQDLAVNGATSATIDEGGSVELTGNIAGTGTFTLDIDWDGDTQTDETLSNLEPGPFSITHPYPDDDPTGTNGDTYDVTVTLSGGETDQETVQVTADNVNPLIRNLTASTITMTGDVTVDFEVEDVAPEVLDITIDWGDESAPTVLEDVSPTTFSETHQYADETMQYVINVTVTDDDGGESGESVTADPANPALLFDLLIDEDPDRTTVEEGGTVELTGVISAPGTVELDWDGDNQVDESLSGLPTGPFSVAHVYEDDDSPTGNMLFTVNVTFTADGGGSGSDSVEARVVNVAPVITNIDVSPTLMDNGETITVPEGVPVTAEATFTDPGLADTHDVTITWGDGEETTLTLTGGERTVSAQHTYNVPEDTEYPITFTIDDGNTGLDEESLTVDVLDTAPSVIDITVDPDAILEGQTVTVSGTFEAPLGLPGVEVGLLPTDFTSLGVFDPASNVTIDTTTLSMTGGATATGQSVGINGPNGPVDVAVFTFDSIEVDAGITVTATGDKPLALLSLSDISVAGTIDVSAAGVTPGAGGGSGGIFPTSASGGPAAGAPLDSAGQYVFSSGGGGGAFGGEGGRGSQNGQLSAAGGLSHGDLSVAVQGGSGGAVGAILDVATFVSANGGGGGGGLELGAVGTLEVLATGSLLADGADGAADSGNVTGGGGAGGGLLLHGFDVSLAGNLSANGGNAPVSDTENDGGGGGGGRILVAYDANGSFGDSSTQSVNGGSGGVEESGQGGDDGTIDVLQTFDPSELEMFTGTGHWSDGVTTPVTVNGNDGTFETTRKFPFDQLPMDSYFDVFTVDVTINNGLGQGDSATSPEVTVNNVFGDHVGMYNMGLFYLDTSGGGTWHKVSGGDTFRDFGISPIRETGKPVIGDWDGNGTDDLGLYNDGKFYLDTTGNGVWDKVSGGDTFRDFGIDEIRATATPVIGDWDGDNDDDLGLYDNGFFYLDTSGNGVWDEVAGGDTLHDFGINALRETAKPVIGDWDGDHEDDLGLYNDGRFYLDTSGNGTWDKTSGGDTFRDFGISAIRPTADPVIGDWDGDNDDDLGLHNDGFFYLDTTQNGVWDDVAGGDTFRDFGIAPIRSTGLPVAGRWVAPPDPLLAAGGPAIADLAVADLTQEQLAPVLDEALALWTAAGTPESELLELEQLDVKIADLPGATLGLASATSITIDVNAAGHGWFVETYEGQRTKDEVGSAEDDAILTIPHSDFRIPHSMDLLTAVVHEMGHALGLEDDYADVASDDLMNGWLEAGVHRTPTANARDQAFADCEDGLIEDLLSSP